MQESTAAFTFRFLRLMTVLLLPVGALAQATINVPRDQPTIQAAINAASDGDTVLVAPGKYVENINFQGKAITVTSSGGAANTILDGGAAGPAVTFADAEPRAAVLSGLTIQNAGGYGSNTTALGIAGVLINSSSPTILNNIITQNQCWDIEVLYAAPLIQGNTISSTTTPAGGCGTASGAGIYVNGNLNGDASSDDGSGAIVTGNTIQNITMPAGAGTSAGGSNVNSENGGAGIAVRAGSPLIENNILRNNSAPGGNGGAINIAGGSGATIAQNLIYGNSAGCGGGAISFGVFTGSGIDLLVANNTIVDNTGGSADPYASCGDASQIYGTNYGLSTPNVIFVNNIVSGNTAAAAIGCSTVSGAASEANQSIFDHNLLYNAGGSVFGPSCVDVSAKYGNLSAAPQYANAAQADYHLLGASPGVDTGNNSVLGNISFLSGTTLAKDLDGNGRVRDATGNGIPIIDMGAYEHAGAVDGSPTTILLSASTYAGTPGGPLFFSAVVASPLGVPTGSLTFFLDGQQLGVSPISTTGNATLNTVVPAAGTHNVYAAYAGTGLGSDSFIAAESVILIVTGEGSPATKTYTTNLQIGVNINPLTYGEDGTITIFGTSDDPNPTFSPSPITLTLNHGAVLASVTPVAEGISTYTTSTLPVGQDTITATYAGDATHQASSASTVVQVLGIGTSITMYCSANPIYVGQTSSLSVTVTAADGSSPTGPVIFSDDGVTLDEVTLVNGTATLNYLGRSIGSHVVQATYRASGAYGGAGSTECYVPPPPRPPPTVPLVVLGLNSQSVLSVNPTTVTVDGTTTLTATVSPANPPGFGTPTGTVQFSDGPTVLGTAKLVGGVATLPTFALPFGGSSVTCAYQGDTIYAPSNCNTVPVSVVLAQTSMSLTVSANPAAALTPVNFFIRLSASSHPLPDGLTVQISLNNQTVALTLDPDGTAEYSVSNLEPGTYPVTATFAGNSSFSSASDSLTETVTQNGSTTTLSASPNPAYAGQPVTLSALVTAAGTLVPEGGSVTFYDGTAVLGMETIGQYRTATLTTSSLAAGVHLLTAVYAGANGISGSTSQVVSETILTGTGSGNPSTTALSASPNPAYAGQPVLLSAVVSSLNAPIPGGSVTFYDGTAALGMEITGQSGTATLTTSSLAPGIHSLTASYAGASGIAGSTSPVVSETIVGSSATSSFTISLSPSTVTVPAGQAATVAVQLASIGGFAGPLTLSYSSLPANASASFLPSVVTLTAGGTGSSTLTLHTATLPPVAANHSAPLADSRQGAVWPALLAPTLLLLLPGRGRRWGHWLGGRRRLLLWLALSAALLQTVTGCTLKFDTLAAVAPGTYEIQVTATDGNLNKRAATLTVVVPVQ